MARRPPKPTVFTAVGYGEFPFDMLRYDSCFPFRETDSGAMAERERPQGAGPRRVTLVRPTGGQPTIERWRSFGWNVEVGQQ